MDENEIAQEMSGWAEVVDLAKGIATVSMIDGAPFAAAAAEIKRLRELGDQLADTLREAWFDLREYDDVPMPDALVAWERGRNHE